MSYSFDRRVFSFEFLVFSFGNFPLVFTDYGNLKIAALRKNQIYFFSLKTKN